MRTARKNGFVGVGNGVKSGKSAPNSRSGSAGSKADVKTSSSGLFWPSLALFGPVWIRFGHTRPHQPRMDRQNGPISLPQAATASSLCWALV